MPGTNGQHYQFRWATWRGTEGVPTSTSSAIGLDNVTFSILASNNYTSISTQSPAAGLAPANATNVVLQRIDLSQSPAASGGFSGLTVTTDGTYLATDLLNLKLRFSNDGILDGGDATLTTKSTGLGAGPQIFGAFLPQTLPANSSRYIFITADIAPAAVAGRTISISDLDFTGITLSGTKLGTSPLFASNIQTFLGLPGVSTSAFTNRSTTTITLNGNLVSTGGANITEQGFYYSTTNGFPDGTGTKVSTIGSFGTGLFLENVTGLSPNTIYYYKSFATNAAGTTYTSQSSFTTLKTEPTNQATAFACGTTTFSSLNVNWTDATGAMVPDGYLIRWNSVSYASIPDPTDGVPVANGTSSLNVGAGLQTGSLSGLAPSTTYFIKIFAYTNSGAAIDYRLASVPQVSCGSGSGIWENVETGSKPSYPASTVALNSGTWMFDDALIGTSANDQKNGSRSARLRNPGGMIRMDFDIPYGVNTVTLQHARYSGAANSEWILEASTNGGSSWAAYSSGTQTTSNTTLQAANFTLNLTGNVRLRIRKLSNSNLLNIDDITYTPNLPCTAPESASELSATPGATTAAISWTSGGFGDGSMAVIRPLSADIDLPENGTPYTPNADWASAGQIDANNRVVFRSAGNSVTATGLTAGTLYEVTVYNYNNLGICYALGNAPKDTFMTLSTEPGAYPVSFTSTPISNTQINLSFSAPNTIANCNGYVVLQTLAVAPLSVPMDGFGHTEGEVYDNAIVAKIITNPAATAANVTGLNPNTEYRYYLYPFNWDGADTRTLNYRNSAGEPMTSATTLATPSILSDIVADPSFVYSSAIPYINFQNATASSVANSVAVFRFEIRDGGGHPDPDLYPTKLNNLTITGLNLDIIRGAALFGGPNQDVHLADALVGTTTLTFTNLAPIGANVTAIDDNTQMLTLRVTFESAVADKTQMQFNITEAQTEAADDYTSSWFKAFTTQMSNMYQNRNRVEVVATAMSISSVALPVNINQALSAFTIRAVDALGNQDVDENSCTVNLTKGLTTLGNLTVTNPYTFTNGAIVVTNASFDTPQIGTGRIVATANGACLASLGTVNSALFNITETTFISGDYQSATGAGLNFTTAAHWRMHNGTTWNAFGANGTPGAAARVFVVGTVANNALRTVNTLIIENGGTVTNNAALNITAAITVKPGGNLGLNANMNVFPAATFRVENGGSVNLNYLATNTSTVWNGTEVFMENSNFTISNWDINNANTALRPVLTGTNISATTINSYTAAFGNLTVNISSASATPLTLLASSLTKNLAHGNVSLSSSNVAQPIAMLNGGNATSGIKGNLTIPSTYAVNGIFEWNLVGELDFTVEGNTTINRAQCRLINSTTVGHKTELSLKGNLTLAQSTAINFCHQSTSNVTSRIKLGGNIDVASNSLIYSAGIDSDNFVLEFNHSTGDYGENIRTIAINSIGSLRNSGMKFLVSPGAFVSLSSNLELGDLSNMVVSSGATLRFGTAGTPRVIQNADFSISFFYSQENSVLIITSPEGLNGNFSSLFEGNLLTEQRYLNQSAYFHYLAPASTLQTSGNAVVYGSGEAPNIHIICEIDPTSTLLLTDDVKLGPLGELDIRSGTVQETEATQVTGDGRLKMSGGVFKTTANNKIVPQLTGIDNFELTGGTISLEGAAGQTLATLPIPYFNVNIGGSGTKTLSGSTQIANNLSVQAGSTLDVGSQTLSGTGGLTLIGGTGKIRYAKTNVALPELTGDLSGVANGVVEYYGSTGLSNSQIIKSKYFDTNTSTYVQIPYGTLLLNCESANYATHNIGVDSSIIVANLQANAPTVFYLEADQVISPGSSTFNLQAGATLKYANSNGITPTACGTGSACGAIRSTNRSFAKAANYWIVGNSGGMVAGTGLPDSVQNLIVSRSGMGVVLSQPVLVRQKLTVSDNGLLSTLSHQIVLSDTAIISEQEAAHVVGKVQTTRNLNLDPHSFGGLGLEVDANGNSPGQTHVVRITGLDVPGAETEAIKRYFSISPTVNSGLNATLRISYFESEINSLMEGDLKFFRSTNSGLAWLPQGVDLIDVEENYLVKSGISSFSDWTLGDINVPLSLQVVSFFGKPGRGFSNLFWQVKDNEGIHGFELLKSLDGKNFSSIGFVRAHSKADETIHDYQFRDADFKQNSYYQLRQMDADGRDFESKPIFLNCHCLQMAEIKVVPNPTQGKIRIIAETPEGGNQSYSLILMGTDGKVLLQESAQLKQLEGMVNSILGNLPFGMYLFKLENQDFSKSFRVQKQ